jgi:hypothetical protein
VARTSSRFATFAHAISSTKPTVPKSTSNPKRTSSTSRSCAPTTDVSGLLVVSAAAMACAMAVMFADAASMVTPSLRRPSTVNECRRRPASSFEPNTSGEYTSAGTPSGNRKLGGITPITVNGAPVSVIDLPTSPRSPPNRRCQNS